MMGVRIPDPTLWNPLVLPKNCFPKSNCVTIFPKSMVFFRKNSIWIIINSSQIPHTSICSIIFISIIINSSQVPPQFSPLKGPAQFVRRPSPAQARLEETGIFLVMACELLLGSGKMMGGGQLRRRVEKKLKLLKKGFKDAGGTWWGRNFSILIRLVILCYSCGCFTNNNINNNNSK